jgi:PAS domain S-box-containing protein
MEQALNKLLLRQLKRHFGALTSVPAEFQNFLRDVSDSYNNLEDDARMFQNSLDISSQELRDAYLKQKRDSDSQKDVILKIKRAIATLNPSKVVEYTDSDPNMASFLFESLLELIEHHKKMEISLKESEHYLREILDSQEVGVMIIDSETHEISFINQKGANLYGAPKENIVGKICHEFICPTVCGDCKLANTEVEMKSTEKILLNVNGEKIPILKSVVHSVFNSRKCLVESFVDITVRKQAEAEVLSAKEAAQSANIAKSDFLASMSHEIRTPLNGVIGFTDLLMKTELSHTQQQYISTVMQSANSLLDIINDILDFSKIEAGKLELDITQNDLLEISNQVADMVKFQAHQKGLEILINIPPDLPRFVWVDAIRLRQVLVNVLGNAVKFTQKGEIEFKIEYLGINGDGLSDFIFSVRDTGVGISSKYQEKIFEAFSQEDTSTTRKFGGTGLGLTISNKLLGLMGSKMMLSSEPGKGSTFYFHVSLKAMKGNVEDFGNVGHIKKVLIVDDNEHNRFILKEILAFKRIESREAKNGIEAIDIIKEGEKYDAILMDYHMPVIDGIETIRKIISIVNSPIEEYPAILLCSSSDDEIVKAACDELHIRHRLVKPIKMQQLYDALSRLNVSDGNGDNKARAIVVNTKETDKQAYTVMIVEDNPVNMFLAKTILKDVLPNANLIEARNGKIAVDKFLEVSPDFIFMDVQMPVMNGYEATEAIRKLEDGTRVPICALTAGTVKGEMEKCLSIGMDDYTTKPVVRDTIAKIVGRWLNNTVAVSTAAKEPVLVNSDLHFNADNLIKFVDNDKEFQNELLSMAKINLNITLPELEEAVKNQTLSSIKSIAHKMKGTALSACFEILAKQLLQLELMETLNDQLIITLTKEIRAEVEYLNEVVS